jgi:peptide/nickel transport system ATP-binding protein
MSDQMLVLEAGEIRDYADTGTILSNPNSSYTKSLLQAFASASARSTHRTLQHVS